MSAENTHPLRRILGLQERSGPCVHLLDGSSLELERSRELVRSYPPAESARGEPLASAQDRGLA